MRRRDPPAAVSILSKSSGVSVDGAGSERVQNHLQTIANRSYLIYRGTAAGTPNLFCSASTRSQTPFGKTYDWSEVAEPHAELCLSLT